MRGGLYGSGIGNATLDNVRCTGDEQSLLDCTYSPSDERDCHSAGVKCGGM